MGRKPNQPPKKTYIPSDAWTLKRLKKMTAIDLQLAIRMEAADEHGMCVCVTCGRQDHYKKMHAGHFVAGRFNAILFDERNVHPQCPHCNLHLHGNQESYAAFVSQMYGAAVVDELRRKRNLVLQLSRPELNEMRSAYKARIKREKQRLEPKRRNDGN